MTTATGRKKVLRMGSPGSNRRRLDADAPKRADIDMSVGHGVDESREADKRSFLMSVEHDGQ